MQPFSMKKLLILLGPLQINVEMIIGIKIFVANVDVSRSALIRSQKIINQKMKNQRNRWKNQEEKFRKVVLTII
jgi:hypothetical protein